MRFTNDITRETPACFEPTIDYVVSRFRDSRFEKFPQADRHLTTQMKSVGEAMAIGRTFKESLQKAIRSLETGSFGFEPKVDLSEARRQESLAMVQEKLKNPNSQRLWYVGDAYRLGMTTDEIFQLSAYDPWFLDQIRELIATDKEIENCRGQLAELDAAVLRSWKEMGFADARIAKLVGVTEAEFRAARKQKGVEAVFNAVDTCGAEFEAFTPYLYSTYEGEDEAKRSPRKKIMILGGGPNRIGQGIEFDYCCVHAAFALKEEDYETLMVNCNPETVSTDYDTSDQLYFEPLTMEDVMNIVDREKPDGVIVQFGGQTPLKLALPLEQAGVPIIGTSPDSIDLAEDRERFSALINQLAINQPDNGIARSYDEAFKIAEGLGYPVLVRPSYVLGGRAMQIVYDGEALQNYMTHAVSASPEHPVLIDKFLDDAIEVDVDALGDGEDYVIGGIMEHIERAGVHSGDSACSLPPKTISREVQNEIRRHTIALAKALNVRGLMNVQFAVQGSNVFVLEVNPRASRTVPFVSKAIGVPLAKIAAKIMVGKKLERAGPYPRDCADAYLGERSGVSVQ